MDHLLPPRPNYSMRHCGSTNRRQGGRPIELEHDILFNKLIIHQKLKKQLVVVVVVVVGVGVVDEIVNGFSLLQSGVL